MVSFGKNVVLFAVIALGVPWIFGQAGEDFGPYQMLSVSQQQEEFDLLWAALEKNNPRLYAHNDSLALNGFGADLRRSMDQPLPAWAFYLKLAPAAARVRCGHTRVLLPWSWRRQLAADKALLPLRLKFIDQDCYVHRNGNGVMAPLAGTKVLSINGVPMSRWHERLSALLSTDGQNLATINSWMSAQGQLFLSALLDFPETYTIQYCASPGRTIAQVTLQALSAEEIRKNAPTSPSNNASPFNLSFLDSLGGAVLRISTFQKSDGDGYFDFLERAFQEIREKKTAHLILDVRGNGGGHPDYAVALLRHLVQAPFVYFDRDMGYGYHQPILGVEHPFRGRLYCLVDGDCFSTTGHFLALVRHLQLGELIGEATEGGAVCQDNTLSLKLPHSGLTARIARTVYAVAVDGVYKAGGLEPDYAVTPGIDDVLANRDSIFDFAIRRIRDAIRESR